MGENGFDKIYPDFETLPGVGQYTKNALLSFAYGEKVLAVDTNLERIFSRFFSRIFSRSFSRIFSRIFCRILRWKLSWIFSRIFSRILGIQLKEQRRSNIVKLWKCA